MAYIHVVMSLQDFIPFISDILEKNNGVLYIEKGRNPNTMQSVSMDNYKDMVLPDRGKNLNFFISSKQLKSSADFYDDEKCKSIIEGVGGRMRNDSIEAIALRMISKTPEKEITKIFNAIKNKLKKDEKIGMGVQGNAALYRNYFYQKEYVGVKTFKTDFHNDKAPDVKVL